MQATSTLAKPEPSAGRWVRALERRFADGRPKDWEVYHDFIARRLRPGLHVVEVGCGEGRIAPFPWPDYPDVRLTGLDVNPDAAQNPWVSSFGLIRAGAPWPVEASSADLVISRYVLEHVEDPESFLAECRRVLKPGSEMVFLTPNALHPAALVSAVMPLVMKQRILGASRNVEADDVFPTHYRLNTPSALRRAFRRAGFQDLDLTVKEFRPCEYLRFSGIAYFAACLYFAAVRASGMERLLGAGIIAAARIRS